jgi:alkyldihydroxyacetonephosphate synthase
MFDTDRKFWGWGVSSCPFPQPALQSVRASLAARFGMAPPASRPVPELAALRMPEPSIAVPAPFAEVVTAARYHRAAHTYGKAFRDIVRALDGDFAGAPDLVAYPRDEDDITRLLRWAGEAGVAVIPFGGGSSVVGGVEADRATRERFAAVLSLDLCRLDRVLEVDRASRCARVQAGTYGPALEAQLKPHGCTLRHFPQSFEFSTVGGWIATRAGGHYATLYTHIDDFVESVRMVTPAGVLQTRRLPGNGAGPQEDRLVLGSEGAFGVITEAWLRVQDTPRFRAGCTVAFAGFDEGAEACRVLAQSGLFPANARLIERDEALFMGAGDGTAHMLVLGFESAAMPQQASLRAALAICEANGGRCNDPVVREGGGRLDDAAVSDAAADQWKQAFLRAPYMRDEIVRMGFICETFETCTTWANFGALDAAVRAAAQRALRQQCGDGFVTCRFTHLYPDGPAPYYTIVAPSAPGRQLAQWDAIKHAVSLALIEHGGTITHHHAVGKDHRPYYLMQNAPLSVAMLKAAKRAVDPQGIMNPGTLLPPA